METNDGYLINMSRICNPKSFNAVYFQHGTFDNSFTWIVHGPASSVGYQAFEEGFDVFFGNFRGVYPRNLIPGKDPKSYWDYNIDDLAWYDI